MKSVTIREIEDNFDEVLEGVQSAPILVRGEDRRAAVLMSMADYDKLLRKAPSQ